MEEVITPSESVNDLGIIVDHKDSVIPHLLEIARRTKMTTWLVVRSLRCRDADLMKSLLRSVIQTIQDYWSQVWSHTSLPGEINEKEAPLWSFTWDSALNKIIKKQSFNIEQILLFNSLPHYLRDYDGSLGSFKVSMSIKEIIKLVLVLARHNNTIYGSGIILEVYGSRSIWFLSSWHV